MRKNIKAFIVATSLFITPFILLAQKTEIKKTDDLKQAFENYNSKNYSLSFEQFSDYIEKNKANNTLSLEEAYFFQASCAYEMMNNDTDKLLLDFINSFQESHRINDAKFLLANHSCVINSLTKQKQCIRKLIQRLCLKIQSMNTITKEDTVSLCRKIMIMQRLVL